MQANDYILMGWSWLWTSSLRSLSDTQRWSDQKFISWIQGSCLAAPGLLPFGKVLNSMKVSKINPRDPRSVFMKLWLTLRPWRWSRVSGGSWLILLPWHWPVLYIGNWNWSPGRRLALLCKAGLGPAVSLSSRVVHLPAGAWQVREISVPSRCDLTLFQESVAEGRWLEEGKPKGRQEDVKNQWWKIDHTMQRERERNNNACDGQNRVCKCRRNIDSERTVFSFPYSFSLSSPKSQGKAWFNKPASLEPVSDSVSVS